MDVAIKLRYHMRALVGKVQDCDSVEALRQLPGISRSLTLSLI